MPQIWMAGLKQGAGAQVGVEASNMPSSLHRGSEGGLEDWRMVSAADNTTAVLVEYGYKLQATKK